MISSTLDIGDSMTSPITSYPIAYTVRFTYIIGGEMMTENVSAERLTQLLEAVKNHDVALHSVIPYFNVTN